MAKPKNKSMIPSDVAKQYKVTKIKTEEGTKRFVDSDDKIARLTRGKTEKELAALAKANGIADRWKGWANLNPGQRKMCLNNVLRHAEGAVKKAA